MPYPPYNFNGILVHFTEASFHAINGAPDEEVKEMARKELERQKVHPKHGTLASDANEPCGWEPCE